MVSDADVIENAISTQQSKVDDKSSTLVVEVELG